MLTSKKCIPANPSQSQLSSQQRSSSKRFYQAVYKLIDQDYQQQYRTTPFQDEQVHSNANKVLYLLSNQLFNIHLDEKLRLEGYYESYPILKVQCKMGGFGKIQESCIMEIDDLRDSFQRFGRFHKVLLSPNNKTAYVLFRSYPNAYLAYKLLDKIYLDRQHVQLNIQWLVNTQYNNIIDRQQYKQYIQSLNWQQMHIGDYCQNKKQNKLTCRYQIQIDNQKQFQVARRIIGSKGCNMKKIIEDSIDAIYGGEIPNDVNINQLLKLRLRGRGSGYKQGPDQVESDDNLHLCVSAKDQNIYRIACLNVEKLLLSVYLEYSDYTNKIGQPISYQIKKIDMATNSVVQSNAQPFESSKQNDRISPMRIIQLVQLRNKARRQLNFMEADRIRNYLRNYGVCLTDQKGRRGKGSDVTSWKYIF